MIKDDVLRRIDIAEEGRKLWIDLVETYKIRDHDQVILFPSGYDEWAYYGALYIDDFLTARDSERAVVLCHDEEIKQCVIKHSEKSEILHFSRNDAEKLIALYSLYLFTDNLIIISPDEPAGRNGNDIVGVRGLTVEEVTALGLYMIKSIKR